MDPRQLALWQVGDNMSEDPAGPAGLFTLPVQKTVLNLQVLSGVPSHHLHLPGWYLGALGRG